MKRIVAVIMTFAMIFALCAGFGVSAYADKDELTAAEKEAIFYEVAYEKGIFDEVMELIYGNSDYKKAMQLYEEGNYGEAYEIFKSLDEYKNSEEMAEECYLWSLYNTAIRLFEDKEYYSARETFIYLGNFQDSQTYLKNIRDNNLVLYQAMQGKWRVQSEFERGNSYYYFDINNREFILYFNNGSNEWSKKCNFYITGEDTFTLTNLEGFDGDFDSLHNLECTMSPDGRIISTPRACCVGSNHCFSPTTHNGYLRFIKFDDVT